MKLIRLLCGRRNLFDLSVGIEIDLAFSLGGRNRLDFVWVEISSVLCRGIEIDLT